MNKLENILDVFKEVSRPEILELYDTFTKYHDEDPELISKKLEIITRIKDFNNKKLKSTSWVKMLNTNPLLTVDRIVEEIGATEYTARLAKLVLIAETYGIKKSDVLKLCRGFKNKKSTQSDIDHQHEGTAVIDMLGTMNLLQNLNDKEISEIDPNSYRSIANELLNNGNGQYIGRFNGNGETRTFKSFEGSSSRQDDLGTTVTICKTDFDNPPQGRGYFDVGLFNIATPQYRTHLSIINLYFIKYITMLAETDKPAFIREFNISGEILDSHREIRTNANSIDRAKDILIKLSDHLELLPMLLANIQKDVRAKKLPLFTLDELLQTEVFYDPTDRFQGTTSKPVPFTEYTSPMFVTKKGDIDMEDKETMEYVIISKGNDDRYRLGAPTTMFHYPMMCMLTVLSKYGLGQLPDNFNDLYLEGLKLTRMKLSYVQHKTLIEDIISNGRFNPKSYEVGNLDTVRAINEYTHQDANTLYS